MALTPSDDSVKRELEGLSPGEARKRQPRGQSSLGQFDLYRWTSLVCTESWAKGWPRASAGADGNNREALCFEQARPQNRRSEQGHARNKQGNGEKQVVPSLRGGGYRN